MNKKNNDNKRYFPLRDPENPFKVTLTPITEEQYRALYPDIWATQKTRAISWTLHVHQTLSLEMRRTMRSV